MAGEAGIDHVGHDHRVGPVAGHRPAVRTKPAHLQLGIVGDERAVALQDPLQLGDDVVVPAHCAGDRNEQSFRLAIGERRRNQFVESFRRIRLEPHRQRFFTGCELAQLPCGRDHAVALLHRRRLGQKLLHQRRELQPRKNIVELRPIGLLPVQGREIDVVHREIALDPRQVARQIGLVLVLLERFPLRCFLDLVEVLVDAVERAELLDQGLRSLLADPRHAGDVVDGISPDGHDVDDLLRRQPERFFDALRVVEHFAAGVVEQDSVADELEEVLVRGGEHDVVAAVAGHAGQRAEKVVGLPVFDADHGDAEALQDLVHVRKLHGEVVRHRLAVFLVVDEGLVTALGRSDVEGHGDGIGIVVLQHLPQHLREAVDRVGGQASGVGEAADRVVGAIDVVRAVDKKEGGTLLGHERRDYRSGCAVGRFLQFREWAWTSRPSGTAQPRNRGTQDSRFAPKHLRSLSAPFVVLRKRAGPLRPVGRKQGSLGD